MKSLYSKLGVFPKVKYFGFEKAMKLLKKGYTIGYYEEEKGVVKKYKFFDSSLRRGGEGTKNWLMHDNDKNEMHRVMHLTVDEIFTDNWFVLNKNILKIKTPEECPYHKENCMKDKTVDCGNCEVFPEDCPLNKWIR